MAAISTASSDAKNPQNNGPWGNSLHLSGEYIPGAVVGLSATTDVVTVDMFKIPAGSRLDTIKAVFTALGTAAAMTIGFRWENSDPSLYVPTGAPTPAANYFLTTTSVAAAGTASVDFKPVLFPIAAVCTATFQSSSGTNILPSTTDVYIKATGIPKGV